MVGDAEVGAAKSVTKAWVEWRQLEGRQIAMARQEGGRNWRAFQRIRNKSIQRIPTHLCALFAKVLTVE